MTRAPEDPTLDEAFRLSPAQRRALLDLAHAAAQQIGLLNALSAARASPRSVASLARDLSVAPRRLLRLLEALALDSVVERLGGRPRPERASDEHARATRSASSTGSAGSAGAARWRVGPALHDVAFSMARRAPDGEGWARLCQVLRADHPLPPLSTDEQERYHGHLLRAGAAPGCALARLIGPVDRLLDAGGGLGAYTLAYLRAHPSARAVIVDSAAVCPAAAQVLVDAGLSRRAVALAADLRAPSPEERRRCVEGGRFDAAILCNVLHLHEARDAARIVSSVASLLRRGGRLFVKDLRIAADRSGPADAVLFALGMAIYTDGGDVHPPELLHRSMRAAGLADVREESLAGFADSIVLRGTA